LRRDRRYADIDRPPASITFEAYDPKPTLAAKFAVMHKAAIIR
jgi:hypothetical protein